MTQPSKELIEYPKNASLRKLEADRAFWGNQITMGQFDKELISDAKIAMKENYRLYNQAIKWLSGLDK